MTDKRQVIGIMTDTQRWDMVGCHGKERLRSRNMGTIQEDPPEALTFDHRCSDRIMDFIEECRQGLFPDGFVWSLDNPKPGDVWWLRKLELTNKTGSPLALVGITAEE